MRLLIIEDEQNLARVLKKGLEENNFVVELAHDGQEGLYVAQNYPFDAIILDIMLPKMDGFAVLQSLREEKQNVPVLMLTAKGDIEDRIKGLNTGADDYLPKPFEFSELLARLRSVIRRNKGSASSVFQLHDLKIDFNAQTVWRGTTEIKLSSREYRILEYLALNMGRVIGRTELAEHIYEMNHDLDSNVINVYISYLRNKLDKGYDRSFIHTIRGSGYILKDKE